jgi:cyclopropane fatty-acyl-phospholipid synthase-like methyltransferase
MQNLTQYNTLIQGNVTAKDLAIRELNRFIFTQKYFLSGTRSILDVGCSYGHWLNYITQKRHLEKHLGINVSNARIQEFKKTVSSIKHKSGYNRKPGFFREVRHSHVFGGS